MISRQQLIDSLVKECNVSKHLFSRIPTDAYDFRPTEKQRSTLELLRYLAYCGSAPIHVMLNGSDWKTQWKPYTESVARMRPEEFPAAMDRQAEEMTRMINSIPDEDFTTKEVKHPTGEVMTLGLGLVRMPLSWLTAYRQQLFLYAKQSGAHELGTSNNWHGRDRQV
ncbi:MAG TPA: hypothetical protein VFU15_14895 [Bacteroidia bacterium]|nr:hypothetical protein [Bacteroidia bacterium]